MITCREQFPKLLLVGEEEAVARTEATVITHEALASFTAPPELENLSWADVAVWVDPLDGTKEFIMGRGHACSTLIGITNKGRPIAGIIHEPFRPSIDKEGVMGHTSWGVVGVGNFGVVAAEGELKDIVVITSTSKSSAMEAMVRDLGSDVTDVLKMGACGNKELRFLEQKANVFLQVCHNPVPHSLWSHLARLPTAALSRSLSLVLTVRPAVAATRAPSAADGTSAPPRR